MRYLILSLALMLTACVAAAPRSGDILVIGDSIMAWNAGRNADIGSAMAGRLNRDVTNLAVAGAQFDNGSAVAARLGFDIRAQYPGGPWSWVVLNGGANDLGFDDCGCADCSAAVDGLISDDLSSGAIPAFVARLRGTGARVLWLGYYTSPGTSFRGCTDDFTVLENRIARLAQGTGGVWFLDGDSVIDRDTPAHFARDDTHPSPEGSALLGTALADLIRTVDGRFLKR